MNVSNKREPVFLLLGDIVLLSATLWLTLFVRYGEAPSTELLSAHFIPFSLLFVVWLLIFFIAGLYDRHTTFFKTKLPDRIIRAQIANVSLAAVFFFLVPYFGITPKTNLFIYLVLSSFFIIMWRLYIFPLIAAYRKEGALLIAHGVEGKELYEEVNANTGYMLSFLEYIDINTLQGEPLSNKIFSALKDKRVTTVVVNANDERVRHILPHLYKPIFSNTQFVEFESVYEEVFERVPLQSTDYECFLKHGSDSSLFKLFKRSVDIAGAFFIGLALLLLLPFIWLSIKLEGGGPVFMTQKRIGRNNAEIVCHKIRTMTVNKQSSAEWTTEEKKDNKVTKTGALLRRLSIDELPQCIAILRGDMSLIGPRSDILGLGLRLEEKIPYYNIRYSVQPGITGWAQVRQQYAKGNISPQSVEESKLRLAYDLYYVKNQSILLDVSIALRTIKTLMSRFI